MKYDIETDRFGTKRYYTNNVLHREGAPAIESANGTKQWYKNGKLHRDGGPAQEYADGTKCWYKNGELHREDGPAAEAFNENLPWNLNNKNKHWALNNKKYGYDDDFTNESWQKFIKTIIFS